ncbi:MAG: biotin carboxyl carrier protein [Maribacter sp.]|jgi:biotin carboxyl carrier protein
MEKYLIKVNEAEFDLSKDDVATLDMQNLGAAGFHVLKDNKSYDVQVIAENLQERRLTIAVNGNTYVIKISDVYDQLVQKMGLLSNASQKAKNILAPMPGLIMDVMVQAGQEIEEGTPLLVLSAMKMENQILSQGGGTIKSIAVKVGDTVDKGQLIIEMES